MNAAKRLRSGLRAAEQDRLFERWFGSEEGLLNFVFEACYTSDAAEKGSESTQLIPRRPALEYALTRFLEEPIIWLIGSRKVVKSWLGYSYVFWRCLKDPHRNIALVQQKLTDGQAHIERRIKRALWHNLPGWLKARIELRDVNGLFHVTAVDGKLWDSTIAPFPQGSDQLRYDTFSIILADEIHAQDQAEEFYRASVPTILGSGSTLSQFIGIMNARRGTFAERQLGPGRHRLIAAAGGAPAAA